MKIGIFGGSFNPVHKGHLLVADYAFKTLNLDKLIFVPTYKNPFKNKQSELEVKHRVAMLKLVIKTNYEISSFEINRKTTSYSIDAAKYFRQKYPNDQIFWLIGSDNLKKINKWKNINELARLVTITVFKRSANINQTNLKKYHGLLLKNPLYDFTSTAYKHGNLQVVEPIIQAYIGKNHLYLNDFLSNFLTPLRYKHSLATAKFAVKLAKNSKLNLKQVYLAGLLHDLTKNWPLEKQYKFLHKSNIDYQQYNNHELHALSASVWLKTVYLLDDLSIIQAIAKHTNLDAKLTLLDKIVYAADKLCDGRKWIGIQSLRILIHNDFDKGFKNLVQIIYKRLKKEGKKLSPKQIAIYEKWAN